jgi:hypothetical protein
MVAPSQIEINEQVSNMNSLLSRVVGEDIEILVELARTSGRWSPIHLWLRRAS